MRWFCGAVRSIVLRCVRAYWGITVDGRQNLEMPGACILAPVHRSFVDFLVVAAVARNGTKIKFMAKDTLWKWKLFGRLLFALGSFPVHREGSDREALRRAAEVLEKGEVLVLFPEGTRRSGSQVEDIHDGAAFLALRCAVPIVPIGIAGSQRALPKGSWLPRPVRIHVVIGERIMPTEGTAGKDNGASRQHRSALASEGADRRAAPREASGLSGPTPQSHPRRRPARSSVRALTEELRSRLQDAYSQALAELVSGGGRR